MCNCEDDSLFCKSFSATLFNSPIILETSSQRNLPHLHIFPVTTPNANQTFGRNFDLFSAPGKGGWFSLPLKQVILKSLTTPNCFF